MWSFFIVFLHPLLGLLSDFTQVLKYKHVEYGFTITAIEAFDETILHRFAGFDELERHAMLLGRVSQGHGNEFWSIIQPQLAWIAVPSGDPLQRAYYPRRRQVE